MDVIGYKQNVDFPQQKVSAAEKAKPEWYANCCDYVISSGLNCIDTKDIEDKYNFLKENISEDDYKKILNPYNVKEEKYKRFPATMRNYDIVSGIIRRYVGEYIQNAHDFIVSANNPEVVLARNVKLNQELTMFVQQQIAQRIQQELQSFVQQGGNPEEFNPQQAIDIDKFIEDFNENYIDDISAQGQAILDVIDDLTDSIALYARAYFEWVTFGSFYTYTEIKGNTIHKRVISNRDAFPTPNDNQLVEDFDMFAERRKMSLQQIMDEYSEDLSDKEKDYLISYYKNGNRGGEYDNTWYWNNYKKTFPDICKKFNDTEIKQVPIMTRDLNQGLIDVWKTVWKGEVKKGILTYQNNGLITTRIVDETYKLNKAIGDISIEWYWDTQVYECDRIGGRHNSIYPFKARPIDYNRNGKLPYNGLMELLPGYGKFSIIDIIKPYQIFGNIVAYHREMAIAKNKLNVLMIAKSLLGTKPDDTIYKMAADGVLYIDDEDDQGMLKAQQVRMLETRQNDYITQLGQLLQENEQAAMMKVDMTPQRYGAIANSAGKGVTEEAVIRGSMGSVIVEFMFDWAREHDYARDLDYTKLAWIDGLNTSYKDKNTGSIRYLSLDVNSHIYADYVIKAKLSVKEREKLNQYKQFAFSAAQNGDMSMAVAAIEGDNCAEIKRLIDKLQDAKTKHEETMKQMEQQIEQMKQQNEIAKIQAEGEQDRETLALEKYLDSEIESLKAMLNSDDASFPTGKLNEIKESIEREKLNIEREKNRTEAALKNREINAKILDSNNKLKIAKSNKNKYDK